MNQKLTTSLLVSSVLLLTSASLPDDHWITEKHSGYDVVYTSADRDQIKDYVRIVDNGMMSVTSFFNAPFSTGFEVYVHPNRSSLDSTWQKEWGMPEFKSECWMVASGIANKMAMISPVRWDKESCEHKYSEMENTQRLITHELAHVFHGQKNVSKDFSDIEGLDWFVEGLAVYVSGQLDKQRLSEVKNAITSNEIPAGLDQFWSGKIRYGLSGSVVMYIDRKYGRESLDALLSLNKKSQLLSVLNVSEAELLSDWRKYVGGL
ncbi:MAG: hypothetical protein AB7O48_19495 [Cyclobacteriaceae bacterium]